MTGYLLFSKSNRIIDQRKSKGVLMIFQNLFTPLDWQCMTKICGLKLREIDVHIWVLRLHNSDSGFKMSQYLETLSSIALYVQSYNICKIFLIKSSGDSSFKCQLENTNLLKVDICKHIWNLFKLTSNSWHETHETCFKNWFQTRETCFKHISTPCNQ